jgi:hypothetical protein
MLIVLHAGIDDGQFLLWGESPVAEGAEPTASKRGRKAQTPRAAPFPYDPGPARLAEAVKEALPSLGAGPPETRTVCLPS